jgi:mRNA interferase HigB
VFNVGGNKFRVVCVIHFNRRKLFVRCVLTHKEYDLGKWKTA